MLRAAMMMLDQFGLDGGPKSSRIVQLDVKTSRFLYQAVGRNLPSWLLVSLEHSGNGLFWIPFGLLIMLWPRFNWQLRVCALNLELGFLLDLLLVGGIKMLVKRSRPGYAEGGEYHAVVLADRYSFPSGHASRTVFIAIMAFVFRHFCGYIVVAAACLWAVLTAMSRVLLGRHYLADVLVGSLLGIGVAGVLSQGHFTASELAVSGSILHGPRHGAA